MINRHLTAQSPNSHQNYLYSGVIRGTHRYKTVDIISLPGKEIRRKFLGNQGLGKPPEFLYE